jgi:hypothetical protein
MKLAPGSEQIEPFKSFSPGVGLAAMIGPTATGTLWSFSGTGPVIIEKLTATDGNQVEIVLTDQ